METHLHGGKVIQEKKKKSSLQTFMEKLVQNKKVQDLLVIPIVWNFYCPGTIRRHYLATVANYLLSHQPDV